MAKIEIEINDELLERAKHLAESNHSTLDETLSGFVSDALHQKTIDATNTNTANKDRFSIIGSLAEDADLLDQIVEWAMEARENHPLRQTDE